MDVSRLLPPAGLSMFWFINLSTRAHVTFVSPRRPSCRRSYFGSDSFFGLILPREARFEKEVYLMGRAPFQLQDSPIRRCGRGAFHRSTQSIQPPTFFFCESRASSNSTLARRRTIMSAFWFGREGSPFYYLGIPTPNSLRC